MLTSSFSDHKFYVGGISLNYNEKDTLLVHSIRMFEDDLTLALKNETGKEVDFFEEGNYKGKVSLLRPYILNHYHFLVDGAEQELNFVGFEREDDLIWVYLEGDYSVSNREIGLRTDLLMREFPDQKFICNLFLPGEEVSGQLIQKGAVEAKWKIGD